MESIPLFNSIVSLCFFRDQKTLSQYFFVYTFYISKAFFSTQTLLLNLLWNEPQKLLIDMILLRHAIFCIFVFMCTSRSIKIIWSFIMIFSCIEINHIISLKQPHLFTHFCQTFSLRVLLSFWLIFDNFNLALLKCCLYKKSVYFKSNDLS